MTTYEEWRVTGTYNGEAMDMIWSPTHSGTIRSIEPEVDARAYTRAQLYADRMRKGGVGWTDGPHLHKRTVTVTDWTEVDA